MTMGVLEGGLVATLAAVGPAAAAEPPPHGFSGENVGVAGYDPVSYFPEGGGRPTRGSITP